MAASSEFQSLYVFNFHEEESSKHLFRFLEYPSSACVDINPDIFKSVTHLRLHFKPVNDETYPQICKILEYITPETTTLFFSCEIIDRYPIQIPGHIQYLGLCFTYSKDNAELRHLLDNLPVSLEVLSTMCPVVIKNPPPGLKFINITHTDFEFDVRMRVVMNYFETIPSLETVRFETYDENFLGYGLSHDDSSLFYTRDMLR